MTASAKRRIVGQVPTVRARTRAGMNRAAGPSGAATIPASRRAASIGVLHGIRVCRAGPAALIVCYPEHGQQTAASRLHLRGYFRKGDSGHTSDVEAVTGGWAWFRSPRWRLG